MKKLICILLSFSLLLLLGCSKEDAGSTEPTETETPIRAEVVETFDLTDTQKAQIKKLFDGCDKAFSKLKSSESLSDEVMLTYAQSISDLLDAFNEDCPLEFPREKIDNETDADKKAQYNSIALKELTLMTSCGDLSSAILYATGFGTGSAEQCLEKAVNAVNTYSEFFYGEPRITDDDLDALGF